MNNLLELNVSELRTKINDGSILVKDLVNSCFEQINSTGKLNTCITVMKEQALEKAKICDETDLKNRPSIKDSPLWGIPIMVKDAFCTKGIKTTGGSKILENFVPPYNSTVVNKLNEAGAIIIAKNNMDELAMGISNETSYFGKVYNPWGDNKSPGGSSGGSAAAVVARQSFGSIGTDSGGSIRQPAALCGCVGFKPSYGRISRYGAVAHASSFDQAGVLAKNIDDTKDIYSVIAGHDFNDVMTTSLDPLSSERNINSLKGLNFCVPNKIEEMIIDQDVMENFNNSIELAKKNGANIETINIEYFDLIPFAYMALAAAEASTNLARFDGIRFGLREGDDTDLVDMYVKSRSSGFGIEAKKRILFGTLTLTEDYYKKYYVKAAKFRRIIFDDCVEIFKKFDAMLTPSSPCVAWEIPDNSYDGKDRDSFTQIANMAGLPAISLPMGLGAKSKLPTGLQIIGKIYDDLKTLEIAKEFEKILPSIGLPNIL